ncbi:hypothetical protein I6A60_01195 [Frankia sp. AgB1.9]|uniref:hypothetical protein n=1 Tax=unclassified Frankia TaxID=2632575 RepID=UPI001933B3D7|nr:MULTISPECIES: hypothetical protein [unclassified Frankia]MBL7491493.1 hypothetical protein [Frankia sp. AgW1.1]MBL7546503.1 hypothetical protein [Frankia sp. AgB1.9]MBL7620238.1 hypothetical protein [Frankia sp. AgB1.8]
MHVTTACAGSAAALLLAAVAAVLAARYIRRLRAELHLVHDGALAVGQPAYRRLRPRTSAELARLAEALDTAHLRLLDVLARKAEADRQHRREVTRAGHDLRGPLDSVRAAVLAVAGGAEARTPASCDYERVAATAADLAGLVDALLEATCRSLDPPAGQARSGSWANAVIPASKVTAAR